MIATHAEWLERMRRARQIIRREQPLDHDLASQIIDAGFRSLAKTLHPDMGGDHARMVDLAAARDELRRRSKSDTPANR